MIVPDGDSLLTAVVALALFLKNCDILPKSTAAKYENHSLLKLLETQVGIK